ncbi:MAG: ferredoxin family protein [Thermodesulfobacteriota bacterium]
MLAHYGYTDGSGDFYITIDTDKCNGCGDCVRVCPGRVLEILDQDPNDPLREIPVVAVRDSLRNKIKHTCSLCKPESEHSPLPCLEACKTKAVAHSW